MPNIRRPNVPPMPDRPVLPMPRITGGGKTPYPPYVDYRPVNKMPPRGQPGNSFTDPMPNAPGGSNVPAMPARPGGLPMSNAPVGSNTSATPVTATRQVGPGLTPPGDGWDYKKGGKVSASKRADGIAKRGKTKGKIC